MFKNRRIKYRLISNSTLIKEIDIIGDSPEALISTLLIQAYIPISYIANIQICILEFEEFTVRNEKIIFSNFNSNGDAFFFDRDILTDNLINNNKAFIRKEEKKLKINHHTYWDNDKCHNVLVENPLYQDLLKKDTSVSKVLKYKQDELNNLKKLISNSIKSEN